MAITKIIKAATAGVVAKKVIEKSTGQKSSLRKRDILASALNSGSAKKTVENVAKSPTVATKKVQTKTVKTTTTAKSASTNKSSPVLATLVGAVTIAHKAGKKTLAKQATSATHVVPVLNNHQQTAKNRLDNLAKKNEQQIARITSKDAEIVERGNQTTNEAKLDQNAKDSASLQEDDESSESLFTQAEQVLLRS